MRHLMLGTLALALALPAAASARETAVRSHDLDLAQARDAQLMLRRLDKAALEVCGASIVSVADQQRAVRRSVCYRQAMEGAVAALRAPVVMDLYRERATAD